MVAAFAVWFCIAWIRAELPRKGTLEWIFDFERPHFFVDRSHPISVGDCFWWLIPAAVAAANVAAEMYLTLGIESTSQLLMNTLTPALAAAAVFFLVKSMTGSLLPSLAAGCMTGLTAVLIGEETVFFALTVLSAWLWLSGGAWWLLALSGMSLALATVFDPQFFMVGVVLLIVALIGARQRVIADRIGGFGAVLTVLLPFAAAAVTIPLALTPAALSFGMGFPQCYGRADFWGMIVGYYSASFPIMLFGGMHPWSFFFVMLHNTPCIVLTACGLVVPLVQFFRRKVGSALYLWLWCVTAAVLYVLGIDCTAITGAMVLGYGASRLLRRGRPVRASVAMTIWLLAGIVTTAGMIHAFHSMF